MKPLNTKYLKPLLIASLLPTVPHTAGAQANLEVFGHNKVQYRQFEWKFFDANHYYIYHYNRAGKELSRYISEQVDKDMRAIENRMGGLFPEKVNIFLYNTYDDYLQSNIFASSQAPIQNLAAGTMDLKGDKVVVYFNGDHNELKAQLRLGLAQVVMERMLEGENFIQKVRNNAVLNLPKWVIKGYLDYTVEGWDSKTDQAFKIALDKYKNPKLDVIADKNPELAGKAFWKFVHEKYGQEAVKNILYITQVKDNFNTAVRSVIELKTIQSYNETITFFQNRYASEKAQLVTERAEKPLLVIQNNDLDEKITNVLVSPRGKDVAYVKWKNGEYKVYLEKTRSDKDTASNIPAVLLTGGILDFEAPQDPNYPLIAWNATGFKLGMIYRKFNNLYLKVYDATRGKVTLTKIADNKFDRVVGFTFMQDDDAIVVSGVKNGQSDLFTFRIKRRQTFQITDDQWDDLSPNYISGGARNGIAFLSNRTENYINIKPLPNELPSNKLNAFFYDYKTKSYKLFPLTKNNLNNISQLIGYGPDHFAYLTDENGISNRNVVLFNRDEFNMDTAYSVPTTNDYFGIKQQQYIPAGSFIADVIHEGKDIKVYNSKMELPEPLGELPIVERPLIKQVDGVAAINNFQKSTDLSNSRVITDDINYLDESPKFDFSEGDKYQLSIRSRKAMKAQYESNTPITSYQNINNLRPKEIIKNNAPSTDISTIAVIDSNDTRQIRYVDSTYLKMSAFELRRGFTASFDNTKLDNSFLFTRYQPYTGSPNKNPLGGLIAATLTDKFNDYSISGGLRFPLGNSGTAYFLNYMNLKKRVDWGVSLFRQAFKSDYYISYNTGAGVFQVPVTGKDISNFMQVQGSYPLDATKSVRANIGYRLDQTNIMAQEYYSLLTPSEKKHYLYGRLEFVYDNSINPLTNIYIGDRFKLYTDYMFKAKDDLIFTNSDIPRKKTGGFFAAGIDLRHYRPIYRNIIYAIRLSGAHSGGNEQVLYYLGGVDNALSQDQNRYPTSGLNNYAFQANATTMRGYNQNSRNGNTYMILNAEVRAPLFNSVFRKPSSSNIINNLQAVGFIDFGGAWEGLLPSESKIDRGKTYVSPSNQPNSPGHMYVTLPDESSKGPLMSYGIGLRTKIYNYFIRLDGARNIDRDFKVHIALGLDF